MELTTILASLPHSGPGIRLPRGLGLRLSKSPGVMVLGCSRIGVRPSITEMETVIEAVTAVFQPMAVFQADEPELRIVGGVEHFIWRLYWPVEGVSLAWRGAEQGRWGWGEGITRRPLPGCGGRPFLVAGDEF